MLARMVEKLGQPVGNIGNSVCALIFRENFVHVRDCVGAYHVDAS